MKRVISMTLAVMLILSVAGCGTQHKFDKAVQEKPSTEVTANAIRTEEKETSQPRSSSQEEKQVQSESKEMVSEKVEEQEGTKSLENVSASELEITTETTTPAPEKITETTAPKEETVAPKTESTAPTTESSSQNRADWEKAIDEGIAETMAKIEAEKGTNYEYCYRQCELVNQIRREHGLHAVSYDITKQYLADRVAKDYCNEKNNLPAPGTAYMNSIWIDADDCIHNIVRKSGENRYLNPDYTSMVAGHYADDNGSYWVQLFFTDDSIQQEERELVDGLAALSDGLSALNGLFEMLR